MAPIKPNKINNEISYRTTRSQIKSSDLATERTNINGKRIREEIEEKQNAKRPRPAFGNITNGAVVEVKARKVSHRNHSKVKADSSRQVLRSISNASDLSDPKKKLVHKKTSHPTENDCQTVSAKPPVPPFRPPKVMTRAAARAKAVNGWTQESVKVMKPSTAIIKKASGRRISNEFDNNEDSLYMSAHEDFASMRLTLNASSKRLSTASNTDSLNNTMFTTVTDNDDLFLDTKIEGGDLEFVDFDKQSQNDLSEVSEYTMDIFRYLKEREKEYEIKLYLEKQPHMTKWMRMLVVDWMVEVQETFELNHETLYLAVKILDTYLGHKTIEKEELQLLGATALYLSCKFDERIPPMIADFIYICDYVYSKQQFLSMEMNVLKTINYDLGFPLSYRFVRRYAKCAYIHVNVLTLARYILEYSLMDYETIRFSDSKMGSAALYMALRMVGKPGWNSALEYYSGYKVEDYVDIMLVLNVGLHRKPTESIKTVRNKYSHPLFYEASKVPLMTNEQLLEGTELLAVYSETVKRSL